jgi:hypothetical protein
MKLNRKTLTIPLCLGLLLTSGYVHADSKKWRANNHSDYTVKVFWIAAGCAGARKKCDESENQGIVCKSKILHPGESSDYNFPDGTSDRRKAVCAVDYDHRYDDTIHRKKNGIRNKGDNGEVEWFYD